MLWISKIRLSYLLLPVVFCCFLFLLISPKVLASANDSCSFEVKQKWVVPGVQKDIEINVINTSTLSNIKRVWIAIVGDYSRAEPTNQNEVTYSPEAFYVKPSQDISYLGSQVMTARITSNTIGDMPVIVKATSATPGNDDFDTTSTPPVYVVCSVLTATSPGANQSYRWGGPAVVQSRQSPVATTEVVLNNETLANAFAVGLTFFVVVLVVKQFRYRDND